MVYVFLIALPALESFRTQRAFSVAVRQQSAALFLHRDVVYYLEQPVPLPEYETTEDLLKAIKARQVRWVIARRSDVTAVPAASSILVEETVHRWERADDVARKLVLLEVCPLTGTE
jgi:hypothetical protein